MHWAGRTATLGRWLSWFDRDRERERRASLAVLAGWTNAIDGRTSEASGLARECDALGRSGPDARRRAEGGVDRAAPRLHGSRMVSTRSRPMRARHWKGIPSDSPFRQGALTLGGLARYAAGELESADALMAEAVELSEARRAIPGLTVGLGQLALLALKRGDIPAALRHVERGLALVHEAGTEEDSPSFVLHAVAARIALASGSLAEAQAAIGRVNRLRPRATAALPILSLQGRLETIRACVMLRDGAAARTLLV